MADQVTLRLDTDHKIIQKVQGTSGIIMTTPIREELMELYR